MDLIYTNESLEDVGVLLNYELDMAYGIDENNFECTVDTESHCCQAGYYLYIEGTEYGGIVDNIQVDTESKSVVYSGRTWHGILGSKVIVPLVSGEESIDSVTITTTTKSGSAAFVTSDSTEPMLLDDGSTMYVTDVLTLAGKYLILSGDANACIGYLIERIGLGDLFSVSTESAGVDIDGYQFHRYTDAYTGICKMLASVGLKLKTEFINSTVVLSAVPQYDYSQDEEFDSDLVEFKLTKKYKTVNHLICLGSGELDERTVIHLYADVNGNISQTQTQTGLSEYAAVYDYSSVESEEELLKSGMEELQSLWEQDRLEINFDVDSDTYDVGDIVGALDNLTGIVVSASINKKIIKIENGQITISYEVGE